MQGPQMRNLKNMVGIFYEYEDPGMYVPIIFLVPLSNVGPQIFL